MHIPVFRGGSNAQRLSKIVLLGTLSFGSELVLEVNKCLVFSGVLSLESLELPWQRSCLPGGKCSSSYCCCASELVPENILQAASRAGLREVWEYSARRRSWGEFYKLGCNRKCLTVGRIFCCVTRCESQPLAVFRGSSGSRTTQGASEAELHRAVTTLPYRDFWNVVRKRRSGNQTPPPACTYSWGRWLLLLIEPFPMSTVQNMQQSWCEPSSWCPSWFPVPTACKHGTVYILISNHGCLLLSGLGPALSPTSAWACVVDLAVGWARLLPMGWVVTHGLEAVPCSLRQHRELPRSS